jgi:uncharacterized membrane protein YsdA (DUF1294 family)
MFSLAIIAFALNNFMPSIPVIIWYLVSINLFTFLLFVIDKYFATKDRKRVPEMSLHFFSFAGGVFAALLAMVLVKHKIRKRLFLTVQCCIALVWIVAIYYVLTHLEAIQTFLQSLSA